MKSKSSRVAGFTLVEIMIVVAIIGLLAAIAIPNFVRARLRAQQTVCINNLRQIDAPNNNGRWNFGEARRQHQLRTTCAHFWDAVPARCRVVRRIQPQVL